MLDSSDLLDVNLLFFCPLANNAVYPRQVCTCQPRVASLAVGGSTVRSSTQQQRQQNGSRTAAARQQHGITAAWQQQERAVALCTAQQQQLERAHASPRLLYARAGALRMRCWAAARLPTAPLVPRHALRPDPSPLPGRVPQDLSPRRSCAVQSEIKTTAVLLGSLAVGERMPSPFMCWRS